MALSAIPRRVANNQVPQSQFVKLSTICRHERTHKSIQNFVFSIHTTPTVQCQLRKEFNNWPNIFGTEICLAATLLIRGFENSKYQIKKRFVEFQILLFFISLFFNSLFFFCSNIFQHFCSCLNRSKSRSGVDRPRSHGTFFDSLWRCQGRIF